MRLIDADALRARMYHESFETDSDMQKWDSGCWIRYKLFEKCLSEQPTVQPQRMRGRWLLDNADFWMCDQCGKWIDILQGDADMNFCPNCGARMDGGEQDDN